MPVEVIMPKVDMDMTHGTMATWHVTEGSEVRKGAALFDIETDKAAMEVEAPASGRLHHIAAQPGDKVPVGAVVGWIYPEGERVGPAPTQAAGVPIAVLQTSPDQAEVRLSPPGSPPATGTTRATPAARVAARQAGIALADIAGTGPLDRIQHDDVLAFLGTRPKVVDVPLAAPATWSPEGGNLSVTRREGRGTPIVLIHGFTADSQSWAPLEQALGGEPALIRIDLPGHGKSPRRRIRDFADLARMVIDAFDEAIPDTGQVHLVGHSLGGAVACAIADIRGRRAASLSLISPAGLGPEIDADTLNGIVRATREESLGPWLRRLTALPTALNDGYIRSAMRVRRDPALRMAQADMAAALFPDGVQAFDLRPALSRIECPIQILWGRQDHILPYRHALAADGDFAIHLLAGAGHIPQIECPDRVATIISRQIGAIAVPT